MKFKCCGKPWRLLVWGPKGLSSASENRPCKWSSMSKVNPNEQD